MLAACCILRVVSESKHFDPMETESGSGAREVRHSEVGAFIRLHRERADLSLRRLADRAGISNPYLSQIERGIRRPSAEILKRISRALSISAESLYSRAGLIEEGPNPPAVVEAIEADMILSPRQKQVMLDLYRTLVSAGSLHESDTKR